MNRYRVYYATNENERRMAVNKYVFVIAENRLEAYRIVFDKYPSVVRWGMIEENSNDYLSPHAIEVLSNPPKSTPPAPETHILVSHWRDGERKDKPAGAKYPFVERLTLNGTEYVKYQLTPDKIHTVKAIYTKRAVA